MIMRKNIEIKNVSTEVFYDLALRSFEASWKSLQEMCSYNISYYVDDAEVMSLFIQNVIAHISNHFYKFTSLEGNSGSLTEVNFEEVAERLVLHSWIFCK